MVKIVVTESAIAIYLAWTLTHHKPSHFAIFVLCILGILDLTLSGI